jgi:hypothetical protein
MAFFVRFCILLGFLDSSYKPKKNLRLTHLEHKNDCSSGENCTFIYSRFVSKRCRCVAHNFLAKNCMAASPHRWFSSNREWPHFDYKDSIYSTPNNINFDEENKAVLCLPPFQKIYDEIVSFEEKASTIKEINRTYEKEKICKLDFYLKFWNILNSLENGKYEFHFAFYTKTNPPYTFSSLFYKDRIITIHSFTNSKQINQMDSTSSGYLIWKHMEINKKFDCFFPPGGYLNSLKQNLSYNKYYYEKKGANLKIDLELETLVIIYILPEKDPRFATKFKLIKSWFRKLKFSADGAQFSLACQTSLRSSEHKNDQVSVANCTFINSSFVTKRCRCVAHNFLAKSCMAASPQRWFSSSNSLKFKIRSFGVINSTQDKIIFDDNNNAILWLPSFKKSLYKKQSSGDIFFKELYKTLSNLEDGGYELRYLFKINADSNSSYDSVRRFQIFDVDIFSIVSFKEYDSEYEYITNGYMVMFTIKFKKKNNLELQLLNFTAHNVICLQGIITSVINEFNNEGRGINIDLESKTLFIINKLVACAVNDRKYLGGLVVDLTPKTSGPGCWLTPDATYDGVEV